jgi:hypothetical protein
MYCNADTHKILTSHNFHHLTLPYCSPLPDPVMLAPNASHEGESEGSMLPMGTATDDETHNLEPKRKQKQN